MHRLETTLALDVKYMFSFVFHIDIFDFPTLGSGQQLDAVLGRGADSGSQGSEGTTIYFTLLPLPHA